MSKRAPVLLLMFDKLLFWNVILILLQVLVQEREVAVIEGSLDEIETFGEEEELLKEEEEKEEDVFSEKPIPLWATFDPNEVFRTFPTILILIEKGADGSRNLFCGTRWPADKYCKKRSTTYCFLFFLSSLLIFFIIFIVFDKFVFFI